MPVERIIVLAASAIGSDGKFVDFKDGMYLGGQIRLEAAAQVASDRPDAELTLVGGYNKTIEGNSQFSNRVRDMHSFIASRCPGAKLVPVYSLPCTYHNFVAVFNSWASGNIEADKVGILTNTYHMKRASAVATRAAAHFKQYAHLQFIPLSAEGILERSIESIIREREEQYAARLESERHGLEQLSTGTYEDSCLTKNLESLRPVLARHSATLLSSSELVRLNLNFPIVAEV